MKLCYDTEPDTTCDNSNMTFNTLGITFGQFFYHILSKLQCKKFILETKAYIYLKCTCCILKGCKQNKEENFVLDTISKSVEQIISHPLPDALKLCTDNMHKVSVCCHFMAGISLHFFLGLQPLKLTASLLVFVARNTNWSCLRRRLIPACSLSLYMAQSW